MIQYLLIFLLTLLKPLTADCGNLESHFENFEVSYETVGEEKFAYLIQPVEDIIWERYNYRRIKRQADDSNSSKTEFPEGKKWLPPSEKEQKFTAKRKERLKNKQNKQQARQGKRPSEEKQLARQKIREGKMQLRQQRKEQGRLDKVATRDQKRQGSSVSGRRKRRDTTTVSDKNTLVYKCIGNQWVIF